MTNKGQSLVIFVMLLPVIILLFLGLFKVGEECLKINKIENNIQDVISYGLNHKEDTDLENKLTNLLKANLNGRIKVTITERIKINYIEDDINMTYIGYIKDNKKIIIKEE